MRLELAETVNPCCRRPRSLIAVRRSNSPEAMTRTVGKRRYFGMRDGPIVRCFTIRGDASGRRSPALRARPLKPPTLATTFVLLLPSHLGVANPPVTDR